MASEILKITSGESILLTGNDGGLYFYLRYLLYPQKVYWVNNISLEEEKERSWKYVFRPYETKLRDQNDVRAVTPVVDSLSKKQLGILITL
ncbi:MAG: hypothetical protein HYV40_06355 [Candidatus Levybacteria bacterium]|nr:hypothetical protein [Candidatus Levybacteria bacterium]